LTAETGGWYIYKHTYIVNAAGAIRAIRDWDFEMVWTSI